MLIYQVGTGVEQRREERGGKEPETTSWGYY